MMCYRDSIEYTFNDKRRLREDYAFWHMVSATEENIIENYDDQNIWVLDIEIIQKGKLVNFPLQRAKLNRDLKNM